MSDSNDNFDNSDDNSSNHSGNDEFGDEDPYMVEYEPDKNDTDEMDKLDSFKLQLPAMQMHLRQLMEIDRNKKPMFQNKKEKMISYNQKKGKKYERYLNAPPTDDEASATEEDDASATEEDDDDDDDDGDEDTDGELSDLVQEKEKPNPWSELTNFDAKSDGKEHFDAETYGQNISMTRDAYKKWRKRDKELYWPDLTKTLDLIDEWNRKSIGHLEGQHYNAMTPYFVHLLPVERRDERSNHDIDQRSETFIKTLEQMDKYTTLRYPARLLMWKERNPRRARSKKGFYEYKQWSVLDRNGSELEPPNYPDWIPETKKLPKQWVIEEEVRMVKQPPYLSTETWAENMAIWLWEDDNQVYDPQILCSVKIREGEIHFSQINDVNETEHNKVLNLIKLTDKTVWTFPVIERLFGEESPIQIFVDQFSVNPSKQELGITEDKWVNARIAYGEDTAHEDTHWIWLEFPGYQLDPPDYQLDPVEPENQTSDQTSEEEEEDLSGDRELEKGARRINLYYFHVRPYSTSGSTSEGSNSDDSEDGCDSDTDSDEERNNTNVYDDDSDFIDEVVEYDDEHGSDDELLPINDGRLMRNCQSVNNAYSDATDILPLFEGRVNDQTYTQLQDSDLLFSFNQLLEMEDYNGSDLLKYAVSKTQIESVMKNLKVLKQKVIKITKSTKTKKEKEKRESDSEEEPESDIEGSGDESEEEVSVVPTPNPRNENIYTQKGKRAAKAARKYSGIRSKVLLLQTAYFRAKIRGTLIDRTTTNEGFTLLRKTMQDHYTKQQNLARDEAKATAKNEGKKFNARYFKDDYQNIMDTMLSYENNWRLTFQKVIKEEIQIYNPCVLINDSNTYNLWKLASEDDLIDPNDPESYKPESYKTYKQILAFIASNLMYWREILIGQVFDRQNTETEKPFPTLEVDTLFEQTCRQKISGWPVTLQSVASDGNCGLSSFIGSIGLNISIDNLREQAIQQITKWLTTTQSRTELFRSLGIFKYISLVTMEDNDFVDLFLKQLIAVEKRMRIGLNKRFIRSSNWATLEDLQVFGVIYQVNIRVLREMGNEMKWINVYNCGSPKIIYLFHSGQHFQYLKPTGAFFKDPAPEFITADFYSFYQLKKRVPKQNLDKFMNNSQQVQQTNKQIKQTQILIILAEKQAELQNATNEQDKINLQAEIDSLQQDFGRNE